MSSLFSRGDITCPNCKFEGECEIKGAGGLWLVWIGICCAAFCLWPLAIAAALMFPWLLFQAKKICPRCKFANPIPKSS